MADGGAAGAGEDLQPLAAAAARSPPPTAAVRGAADVQQAAAPSQAQEVRQAAPAPKPTAALRPPPPPVSPALQLRLRVAVFRQWLADNAADVEGAWSTRLTGLRPRGVVVAAGGPNLLVNTFVSLYVLRHSLNCTLPFMVMYWGNITSDLPTQETIAFMEERIPGLEMVDASKLPYPPWQTPLADTPDQWNGWKLKAFAAYAAPFEEIMFLDSDATPALDPQSLFDHPSYRMAGSMFWPDIWCGDPELFRTLRMPSIGSERQTESGMFMVDRRRHWLALEWLLWLNVNNDITYKLAYGDKDTFRAAFFLAGRLNEFYQVPLPLGMLLHVENNQHRMRGFLQAHPNGSAAVLHRVSSSKFDLSDSDPRLISHVTLPSCPYFQQRGWHPEIVPAQNFAAGVLRSSSRGGGSRVNGSIAAALAPATTKGAAAGEPAPEPCPFDTHTLYDASRRCARYDYSSASGGQQLPLFEIPGESHVGRVIAESAAAFQLLRNEVAQRGPASQLFQPTAQHTAT